MLPFLKKELFDCALLIESGDFFLGKSVGGKGVIIGELCFNTSPTGYQEVISDPSYCGQIIVFTFPHIGNVGTTSIDNESISSFPRGIVMSAYPLSTSYYRCEESFSSWLEKESIIGICNVNTRALTQLIREAKKPTRAIIGSYHEGLTKEKILELRLSLENSTSNIKINVVKEVICKNSQEEIYKVSPTKFNHLVIIDFGIKESILEILKLQFNYISILPFNTPFEIIIKKRPDAIVLSNGPGDPRVIYKFFSKTLDKLFDSNIPILGICFGHQLIALKVGGIINRMSCGHHGSNHPVKNLITSKVMITSHNHDYTVHFSSLKNITLTHVSMFDGTIEGFKVNDRPIICVQFHPEGGPGPQDAIKIFKYFFILVNKHKKKMNA